MLTEEGGLSFRDVIFCLFSVFTNENFRLEIICVYSVCAESFLKPFAVMSRLICVIDAGTNKIRFVIYKTPNFEEVCSHEVRIAQISLKQGYLENDPNEIISAVRETAKVAIHLLPNHGFSKDNVACIGITNQRETVVLWDKVTGKPLHNAIGELANDITANLWKLYSQYNIMTFVHNSQYGKILERKTRLMNFWKSCPWAKIISEKSLVCPSLQLFLRSKFDG